MAHPIEITPAKEKLVYELSYEHQWFDPQDKEYWLKTIKHPNTNHHDHPYISNAIAKAKRGFVRNIKLTTIQAKVISEETINAD